MGKTGKGGGGIGKKGSRGKRLDVQSISGQREACGKIVLQGSGIV